MSDAHKATVQRFWAEVVNKGDTALITDVVAPGFVWHGPGGRKVSGPAALRELVATYLRAFPDLHAIIEDQVAEGDEVATRLAVRGTHKGDLDGVAPSGKPIAIAQLNIIRFEGNKFAEAWEVFDELEMMRQIGAIPAAS
jgi:steroid delta-isomerase-like uncharacterized protein